MCKNVPLCRYACLPALRTGNGCAAGGYGLQQGGTAAAAAGLTHRERLQAGIRELQAEMRRLASELGPLCLEGPGRERAGVRAAAPPAEATSGSRLWGC